ncbi:Hypothetical predicted protein [Mytilus galloprovincialis]|uniref:Uncharacterized protein n=1 Tax=Mytilus galloprovincialis TaxID=29158 RepID=A0A8B6GFL0_MYTGA|nr:Hypothetical predicted protein [Mytilus galloprovincialis]
MDDSYCRELTRTLKLEFDTKRRQLLEIQAEFNRLIKPSESQKSEASSEKTCENKLILLSIDEQMCLRHKLDRLAMKLKAVNTAGSQEHIHLNSVHEELIALHKRKDVNTLNTSYDFQKLAHLQSDHEWNCQLKGEIENQINKAYRKIAKQQVLLSRRCSESSDPVEKENAGRLLDDFVKQHITSKKLPFQEIQQHINTQTQPVSESHSHISIQPFYCSQQLGNAQKKSCGENQADLHQMKNNVKRN